jgi:hypothetical protein
VVACLCWRKPESEVMPMSNDRGGVSDEGLPLVFPDTPAHIVGYGVDTLLLNVCYADTNGKPIKQELDERYVTVDAPIGDGGEFVQSL